MARYLFLFRGGDDPNASPEEMQKHMQKWMAWIEGLRAQGRFEGGEPLDRTGKVVRGARKTVTDGPYAESKDLVGGYLLVKASSADEAAELAKGCPIFDGGGAVEVRPIAKMS